MTTGQRVAQKRKELSLSQEALGEKLGVSRQSIYKWESDSALPEVEKLVALSRLFGVSVGWLLGVEEEAASGGGELSEEQLRLAEEIAARYAPSPRRMAVVKVSVAAAALCLCLVLWGFCQRLEDLTRNYSRLEATISQVETGVNGRIAYHRIPREHAPRRYLRKVGFLQQLRHARRVRGSDHAYTAVRRAYHAFGILFEQLVRHYHVGSHMRYPRAQYSMLVQIGRASCRERV